MAVFNVLKYRWIEIVALVVGFLSIFLFFSWSRELDPVVSRTEPSSRATDEPLLVDITLVQNANKSGAVCLDGSLPAYHLHRGSGSGSRNWLIFLQGGGWCTDHASCAARAQTKLGSSNYMQKQLTFGGILSDSPVVNPDFYSWNRVKVRYCDGASFGGNVEESGSQDVMYRGERIWRAVMEDLLSKGMAKAEKALLAGCSAGGLATLLHCNSFKELLPHNTVVKCLNDGGYFIDEKDLSGEFSLRALFKKVVDLQNVSAMLPKDCVSERGEQCFFPRSVTPFIQPQVYFINSGYDMWQIQNVLLPDSALTTESWKSCKLDPYNCSKSELRVVEGFRNSIVESLSGVAGGRLFVNSCFIHCQAEEEQSWNGIKVGNKSTQESVGDWYFEREPVKRVDCLYPCNPTCPRWSGWGH